MKKKQRLKNKETYLPFGIVITDLVLWDFSGNADVIRHNANELAKALQMSYDLNNFGPHCFGIEDGEME